MLSVHTERALQEKQIVGAAEVRNGGSKAAESFVAFFGFLRRFA